MIKEELIARMFDEGAAQIRANPRSGQKLISNALSLLPNKGVGWYNLGLALHQQGKIMSAIKAYKKAIELTNPPLDEAINNVAQDLLLIGEWREGWEYYENRLKKMRSKMNIYYQLYGEPWKGKKEHRRCDELILVAEQGYGDTIQFCRLMKAFKDKRIKTSLFCQENLMGLLKDSSLGKIRSSLTGEMNDGTRWCPLLSVPHRLELTREKISKEKRYIKPDNIFYERWRKKINKGTKTLIGIHWQGNPKFEEKIYSAGRSIPVGVFNVLTSLKDTEFLILQKGKHRNDYREEIGLNIVSGQEEFDKTLSFQETAGAVANCDIVVTSDSSVAHLSSAMGIPTLILLCKIPEWRWGLEGYESIWYESCTLYRQKKEKDWEGVMKDVLNDLKQFKK